MKSWPLMAVLVLGVILVGSAACNPFGQKQQEEQQVARVVRGDLTVTVSGSGSINAMQEAKLSFGTGGKIDRIYVKEGDTVSTGAALARLDTASLELALARANIAREQAELAIVQANVALEQVRVAQDQAGTAVAQANIARDQADFNLSQLKKAAATPSEQIHIAEAQLEVARSQVSNAEAQFGIAGLQLEPATLQLNVARTQLKLAEQNVSLSQQQLDEATMVAPFDGVVGRVSAREKDNVLPNVAVIHLIDPARLELKIQVDEIDITMIEAGQKALIEVDALSARQLQGKVISVGLLPIQAAGIVIYDVKIEFEMPVGQGLRAGMSATADIVVAERENALLVPDRAVIRDNIGKTAVEAVVNGQVEQRPVVTGISDGSQTEILSGLEEGETIVERRTQQRPLGPLFQ
ncbi:MAG: efflux RND transporter periplasmic adaptor subunit [Chloroflexi bacterium]|nr:efflux RND transporter periplasmic adaptor subunit [Chloroflexota bacterium]